MRFSHFCFQLHPSPRESSQIGPHYLLKLAFATFVSHPISSYWTSSYPAGPSAHSTVCFRIYGRACFGTCSGKRFIYQNLILLWNYFLINLNDHGVESPLGRTFWQFPRFTPIKVQNLSVSGARRFLCRHLTSSIICFANPWFNFERTRCRRSCAPTSSCLYSWNNKMALSASCLHLSTISSWPPAPPSFSAPCLRKGHGPELMALYFLLSSLHHLDYCHFSN